MGRRLELRPPAWVALGLGLLYFIVFATLSLVRYDGYHSRSFDLAIVVRMLWGIRHGDFHEVFTDQPWLAYHFEPVLLPMSLVDAVLPVAWLLLLQTGALAAAAIPAWRIGQRALGGDAGGLVGVAIVLLYPVVGHVNVFEFHPVALAIAPALWFLDALDRGARRQAWAAALLVIACREDGFLFVAMALLSIHATTGRGRLVRIGGALACIAAYAVYAFVVTPRLGSLGSVRIHFGRWGSTPADIVTSVVSDPSAFLAHILSAPKRVFLVALLAPLAFLPLLAPRRALPALGPLAVCLLSVLPGAARVADSHYAALVVPGLIASALFGAARLQRAIARIAPPAAKPAALGALVSGAVAGALVWGAAPGMAGYQADLYRIGSRADALDWMVDEIPAQASVSAPIDVVAHVARRPVVHVFPRGVPGVDVAVVDLASRPVKGLSAEDTAYYMEGHVGRALASGLRVEKRAGHLLLLTRGGPP